MTVRFSVLLLVLGVTAHADTLVLRNGTRVSGKWWAADAKAISFLVNDHLEFYPRPDVSEVIFGERTTSNSAGPPTPPSGRPTESTSKEKPSPDNRTKQEQ
jgi:hypothetical protein